LLEKRRSRRSISINRDLPLSTTSPWDFNPSTNHVHDTPATPLNAKHSQSHLHLNDLRPTEVPALADTPSTVGSILVDPPHTAAILNHTRIPILHGRLYEGSNTGQPTAMAITPRATRIPRGRRSLQIPSDWRTSTSETHSYSISPTEPATLTPAYGALRSATNAADHPSVLAPHLCPKDDATVAPALMRSAHRRSASYSSSRPIPGNWDAGLDAVKAVRVKGFNAESVNKENIVGTTEYAGMRSLSSFTPVNVSHSCTDSSGHPKSYLPMTPSRERALLSSYPSPASSTELSPLGQKMMADLRKQRQVRGERRRSRLVEAANTHV
jgi:hypothetical protein